MKTSRRLVLGTFVALLTAPVMLVAYSRVSGGSINELPAPERMTQQEIAALRDFAEIEVRGDFALELVSASDYAVEYAPLPQQRSFFRASVADGTLSIQSYGNRNELGVGTLRIALPELSRIDAESLSSMTISNFDSDSLDIRALNVENVVVADNRLGVLRMDTQVRSIEMRGNTIGNTEVRTLGTRITTD